VFPNPITNTKLYVCALAFFTFMPTLKNIVSATGSEREERDEERRERGSSGREEKSGRKGKAVKLDLKDRFWRSI